MVKSTRVVHPSASVRTALAGRPRRAWHPSASVRTALAGRPRRCIARCVGNPLLPLQLRRVLGVRKLGYFGDKCRRIPCPIVQLE